MRVLLLLALGLLLVACGGGSDSGNQRLLDAFKAGNTGFWITVDGPVREMFGDETIGGKQHQKFSFQPAEGMIVQVRHSLADSDRVPVEPGDRILVQGYYQWDPRGGFISRTFFDEGQPGSGGWVEHDNARYD